MGDLGGLLRLAGKKHSSGIRSIDSNLKCDARTCGQFPALHRLQNKNQKHIYVLPTPFFGHRDFPSSSRLSDSTHARTTSHNSVCRGVRHIRPRALQHIFETLLSWLHTKIMGMGRPSSNPCRCKSVEHPSKKPDIVADNEVL